MKGQGFIVLGALLLACVLGVGIPYYMTAGVREGIPDPRLQIPNTGGSPTPTISTERALTQAEYARLVYSPTPSFTPTITFTLQPSQVNSLTATTAGSVSPTPSVTATSTRRPFFPSPTSQSNQGPAPTFTRTPTRTRTPTPIPTRTPTQTPSRTPTLPTATPLPTVTPIPTATPVTPTATTPTEPTPIEETPPTEETPPDPP